MFKTASSLVFLAGSALGAEDIQACMHCKRADSGSGFGVSYSYCPDFQDEKCFKNFGEYLNPSQLCVSEVIEGYMLDIDANCKAKDVDAVNCPSFESSEELYGTILPAKSIRLGENEKCTVKVDGTNALAKVSFGGKWVGVLYPGYQENDVISVSVGQIKYVTIYNGQSRGSINVRIFFSSAKQLALSAGLLASATAMASLF